MSPVAVLWRRLGERLMARICNSLGEFTVAKDQYIRTRSGWFSDRSVCYLAAGHPVITKETVFSKFILSERGFLLFETMVDVLAAIDAIQTGPEGNRRTACELPMSILRRRKSSADWCTRSVCNDDSGNGRGRML
jgi:hypothetical protein